MWYRKQMEALLTAEDRAQLSAIHAPKVVGIQPEDSRRCLCVMPDGEIRAYGKTDDGKRIYIASRDCGLSWKQHEADPNCMGAAMRIGDTGRYVTTVCEDSGTYALLSDIGPDDTHYRKIKICDCNLVDMFQPKMLRTRRRLVSPAARRAFNGKITEYTPVLFYSDDDGESWSETALQSPPLFEAAYPHLSPRWQNNGVEPSVTELPDGRLMYIARTSLDYLYIYYSSDSGETWTSGECSRFHCTLTTPYLLTLESGKTLLLWNNTQPLPEGNKHTLIPPQGQDVLDGCWEDVFTNRDASHAAISEDGETWVGFRELLLNHLRNEPDFRSRGGLVSSHDRSVHQFQAIELPDHRILVAAGQNNECRRMLIFAEDWLYETRREETFEFGMTQVSTQLYVRSFSGSLGHGHCAWNRTDGALLVPSPDGALEEALQLCRIRDERLFDEHQGVVWNFPKLLSGEIELELTILGSGVQVCLCDHWFNPCDRYVPLYAPYFFTLTADLLEQKRTVVTVRFDTLQRDAAVYAGDRLLFRLPMVKDAPDGLSYVHLQTLAESHDPVGTYLHRLRASGC